MPRNDKLYTARVNAGMTQLDLADQSGVKENKISRIETGRLVPDEPTMDALCKVLKLPRGKLF